MGLKQLHLWCCLVQVIWVYTSVGWTGAGLSSCGRRDGARPARIPHLNMVRHPAQHGHTRAQDHSAASHLAKECSHVSVRLEQTCGSEPIDQEHHLVSSYQV